MKIIKNIISALRKLKGALDTLVVVQRLKNWFYGVLEKHQSSNSLIGVICQITLFVMAFSGITRYAMKTIARAEFDWTLDNAGALAAMPSHDVQMISTVFALAIVAPMIIEIVVVITRAIISYRKQSD